MAQGVKVTNLSVVFGKKKQKKQAIAMLEDYSPDEIRQKTGATVAVKNLNLDIKANELFVIVGLSGSGKSTFIRTLNLLNQPAKGTVEVGGRDLNSLSKTELRKFRRNDVSMVFQHFGLISHRTVLKNVEFPLEVQKMNEKERYERAMAVIKTVGLEGWENHYPRQLSGGMRQRVGLARALTTDPGLLLMDEPYSALDPLIRREMQNQLLQLEDDMDRTIVFITHDMNEAFRLGDRIALLKDAQIVQIGTPQEFFDNPANDYVRNFIIDVDKTRILKVRSIIRKLNYHAVKGDLVKDTLEVLQSNNLDFCYVVTPDKLLMGYVTLKKLKSSMSQTIDELIQEDDTSIYRNAYLYEAWQKLNEAQYDLPVVDGKGRLCGILDYDAVAKALANKTT